MLENKSLSTYSFTMLPRLVILLVISITFSSITKAQSQEHYTDYNPNTGTILFDSIGTNFVIVEKIILLGNKKTKDKIILREINLAIGDTLYAKNITKDLLWIKNRIFNLTLFLWVDIKLRGDSIQKTLTIEVLERLNISPMPEGGLADRNFNEWWVDRNRDLSRIYLGVNIKMKNVWGLAHVFKVRAYAGFNEKVESSYTIPYINKKLKTGISIFSLLEFNPQVAYRTFEHKLDYYEFNQAKRKKYQIGFMFIRRNAFYNQHQFGPYFQFTTLSDSIVSLNPDYFLNSATYQRSYGLKYLYSLDKRDFNNYPLKGYLLKVEADYQRIDAVKQYNVASIKSEFTQFIPLGKGFYMAASAMGKASGPKVQPYFTQRGLGYGKEYISGYELYVIDGQVYGLIKSNFKWKVFSINPTFNFIPHHKFRTIPISMYFKIYADAGYVVDNTYNPYNNFLTNRLLKGGGVGVDIVTYLQVVGRIEYSINQLGQTGLFLHLRSGW